MSFRPLRLLPGTDLRRELERLARHAPEMSGFVVCGIGSLESPSLRFADRAHAVVLPGPFEVVCLAGTVTRDGAHLHMVVADGEGHTFGGHVDYGNRVRTTMEVLLAGTTPWQLGRSQDAATGYLELVITPADERASGGGAA